jgi:hypothetical protein
MTAELRSEVAGSRIRTWHLMPTERMGPPPGALPPMRMTASWSGSNDPTAYKSVTRRCTQWRALLGSSADRQPSDAGALQKAPVAVHHRSACSGVKALRNTSPARRQAAKLCYRFGPLTPSARSANLIAGDGTRNGCLAPNKEPVTNQKHDLTGKAPYRFESISLQRRVTRTLLSGGIEQDAPTRFKASLAGATELRREHYFRRSRSNTRVYIKRRFAPARTVSVP